MEVIISGRNYIISDDLRKYTTEKMVRLEEEYGKMTAARVVMEMERNWQIAEARVTGKQLDLQAKASTNDMYISVDEVFAKIQKQLRKQLSKMREHRAQPFAEATAPGVDNEDEEADLETEIELEETV